VQDIRVVVGKMPRLLGEIILNALTGEKAVRVVGVAEEVDPLVELCGRVQPDVVVLGLLDAHAEGISHRLLSSAPWVKVVALASNGSTTLLFELRPQKVEIGELSPSELGHVVATLLSRESWRNA